MKHGILLRQKKKTLNDELAKVYAIVQSKVCSTGVHTNHIGTQLVHGIEGVLALVHRIRYHTWHTDIVIRWYRYWTGTTNLRQSIYYVILIA